MPRRSSSKSQTRPSTTKTTAYVNWEEEAHVATSFVAMTSDETEPIRALMLEAARDNPNPEFLFGIDKFRWIFQAAMEFSRYPIKPTPEEYATWMEAHGIKGMEPDRIRDIVEEVRGPEGARFDLGHILWLLGERLPGSAKEREARQAGQSANNIITSGVGPIEDRLSEAISMLSEAQPPTTAVTAINGSDMGESYQKTLSRRRDEIARGLSPITLPESWGMKTIYRLNDGEMTLLTGPSGTFKSTLCLDLCLWNAMRGNGKIRVVYYHLENLPQNVQDRIACRWLRVPIEELRQGQHAEEVDKAWAERPWMSNFTTVHCPGVPPEVITQDISRRAFALPDEDSLLLAVIDYLDKDKLDLRWMIGDTEAAKLGSASGAFKSAAEQYSRHPKRGYNGGVHIFLAQQQNEVGTEYGSRKARFQSQLVLALESKKLEDTQTFGTPPKQITVKSGMNSPILRIRMSKANDAEQTYSTLFVRGDWYTVMGAVDDSLFEGKTGSGEYDDFPEL